MLDLVEAELEKYPDKTFSHLCKEALWQFLGIPVAFQPHQAQESANADVEAVELKRVLTDFKQDFWERESNRDEAIESSLDRLSEQLSYLQHQLTHLEVLADRSPQSAPAAESGATSATLPESPTPEPSQPREVDPVLDHLSQFLDEF
ncbi:MAG: hypothetical protein WBB29_20975 [Geitlerinemataceae cyanobacterium]